MNFMCNEVLEWLRIGDAVERGCFGPRSLPTVDRVCKPATADDGQCLPGNQVCMHLNADLYVKILWN